MQRVQGPLFAHRSCSGYYESTTPASCAGFRPSTPCIINDGTPPYTFSASELGEDTYYVQSQTGNMDPVTVGSNSTGGYANADMVLLITATATTPCSGGTLAYASPCQRDAFDRPTFARVNFCPSGVLAYANKRDDMILLTVHELFHSLGFSADSFPLFREHDAARTPRTARNPLYPMKVNDSFLINSTCNGDLTTKFIPSASTVSYFDERDMVCSSSYPTGIGKPALCVAKFVTPTAVAAAREFFDCPSLNGVEIENLDTGPCDVPGSHLEYRLYLGEAMNPYSTSMRQGITAIVLGVLQDSGWYKANFSSADVLRKGLDWGYKQGCSFATSKCINPSTGMGIGSPPHFYSSSPPLVCRIDRRGYGSVSIGSYASPLPAPFRYFTSDAMKGGPNYSMDYCPYLNANSRLCSQPAHATNGDSAKGMIYGQTSMCLGSSLLQSGFSGATGAGCYSAVCTDTGSLLVTVALPASLGGGRVSAACTQTGQLLTFSGFSGSIVCPDVTGICEPAQLLLSNATVAAVTYSLSSLPAGIPAPAGSGGGSGGGNTLPSSAPTPARTPSPTPSFGSSRSPSPSIGAGGGNPSAAMVQATIQAILQEVLRGNLSAAPFWFWIAVSAIVSLLLCMLGLIIRCCCCRKKIEKEMQMSDETVADVAGRLGQLQRQQMASQAAAMQSQYRQQQQLQQQAAMAGGAGGFGGIGFNGGAMASMQPMHGGYGAGSYGAGGGGLEMGSFATVSPMQVQGQGQSMRALQGATQVRQQKKQEPAVAAYPAAFPAPITYNPAGVLR